MSAWRTLEDVGDFGDGPVRWSYNEVSYQIEGPLPSEIAGADVAGAVQRGLTLWAEPECSAVRPLLASEPVDSPDVVIRWLDSGWTASGLAYTAVGTTDLTYEMDAHDNWRITSAEILLNAESYRWIVASRATASGEADVESVVAHEGAHALGIAHNCEHMGAGGAPACESDSSFEDAVMFPDWRGIKRALSSDDVLAICHSYPSALCGGGCPAGSDCTPDGCTPCTNDRCGGADGTMSEADAGAYVAPPRGAGLLGDPCGEDAECASLVCATDGYCSVTCSRTYPCPGDSVCNGATSDGRHACTVVGGAFGDSCAAPTECYTGLCIQVDGDGACTRECSAATACPSGYDCTSVDERRVCRASSGCSISSARASPAGLASLAGLVLLLLVRRRRRMISRVGLLVAGVLASGCGNDSHSSDHLDGGTIDARTNEDARAPMPDTAPPDAPALDAARPDATVVFDAGPPPCDTPGATRSAPCGNCGLRSEVCGDSGEWEPASECLGEGECGPGEVERMALPMCAEQSRICDDACTWRDWTMTMPPSGVCNPSETRVAAGACTMDGVEYDFLEQACSDECEWVGTGGCDDGCDIDYACGSQLHPCVTDADCVSSLVCAPGGYCSGFRTCSLTYPCAATYHCRPQTDGRNHCVREDALVGDPCSVDEDCGAPLHCLDGSCTLSCPYCPRGYTCDTASDLCERIPDA